MGEPSAHYLRFLAWVNVLPGRQRPCVFGGHRHCAHSESEGECLDYALSLMRDDAMPRESLLAAAQVKYYWDAINRGVSSLGAQPVKPVEPGRTPLLN